MRRGAVAASAKSNLSGRAPNESASSTGLVMDVVYNETHPKIVELQKELQKEGVDPRTVNFLYYAKLEKKVIPHHHQQVVNGFHHIVIMI